MKNLNFGNQDNYREFTEHLFWDQRIYAGDLVEYHKGDFKDIGEVRKKDGVYLVGGKPLEQLEIVRVIDMGGIGANGRYV